MLSFTVPRFVELDIGCLTEELDILPKGIKHQFQQEAGATHMSLLLSNHDRCLQMYVDDHQQFLVTWLEEEMFDITKKYICAG